MCRKLKVQWLTNAICFINTESFPLKILIALKCLAFISLAVYGKTSSENFS